LPRAAMETSWKPRGNEGAGPKASSLPLDTGLRGGASSLTKLLILSQ
jgi:hypothetical protein